MLYLPRINRYYDTSNQNNSAVIISQKSTGSRVKLTTSRANDRPITGNNWMSRDFGAGKHHHLSLASDPAANNTPLAPTTGVHAERRNRPLTQLIKEVSVAVSALLWPRKPWNGGKPVTRREMNTYWCLGTGYYVQRWFLPSGLLDWLPFH